MITRTELVELALKVARDNYIDCSNGDTINFAHALLVEIQKKLEVVGYQVECLDGLTVLTLSEVQLSGHTCTPLTTLPIIEE